jgi:hypothetical protein
LGLLCSQFLSLIASYPQVIIVHLGTSTSKDIEFSPFNPLEITLGSGLCLPIKKNLLLPEFSLFGEILALLIKTDIASSYEQPRQETWLCCHLYFH